MNDKPKFVRLDLEPFSMILKSMTDEQIAGAMRAVLEYCESGRVNEPSKGDVSSLAFNILKSGVDEGWALWETNKARNQKMQEAKANKQSSRHRDDIVTTSSRQQIINNKEEIINNKEYSFKENIKRKSKQEREDEFRNKVADIANGQYTQDMIDRFCDYWTESNEGENCKLKFEMQKTFDIARRLVTWNKNNFNNGNFRNTTEQKSEEQRRAETEAIVNIVFDNF